MMNNMPMNDRALLQALSMGMPMQPPMGGGGGGMPGMPMDEASILQALGYMAGPQGVPMQMMGMPQMQAPMMPPPSQDTMMGPMAGTNYGSDARMRMMERMNPSGELLPTQPNLAEFLKKYGNSMGR